MKTLEVLDAALAKRLARHRGVVFFLHDLLRRLLPGPRPIEERAFGIIENRARPTSRQYSIDITYSLREPARQRRSRRTGGRHVRVNEVIRHRRHDGAARHSRARATSARAQRRQGSNYPRNLWELGDDYFRRFGEQFIENTRVYRGEAPLFIDKIPNNFMHVGLIRLILPNAKVIDARRHPLACCFSGYKQLFGESQDFTYDLEAIGRYYRDYVRLTDHWDRVLPGFVLRVQHEDVVTDLEGEVRKMLDFCSLPFEQSCVEFYRTKRSVRTPSSEQVRQPIYRKGLGQWRAYAKFLDPLRDALGAEILERYAGLPH